MKGLVVLGLLFAALLIKLMVESAATKMDEPGSARSHYGTVIILLLAATCGIYYLLSGI